MSATTVDLNYKTRGRERNPYLLKNGVTVYRGSLIVMKPSTGYADKLTDASGHVFKGVATQGAVGDTSATPVPSVAVDETGVVLERIAVTGASAITDVNSKVYATDDQTFTLTPTTYLRAVGRIVKWYSSTTCDVQLFTAEEYAAQLVAADVTALTDSSGGAAANNTIGAVTAPTALGATLTDSTGQSGTHDDTLAATTVPTQTSANPSAITAAAGEATAADLTLTQALEGQVSALVVDVAAVIALQTVQCQNASDTGQKVIELVAAQAQNRTAIVALTDAITEVATKVNELIAALALQQ